MEGGILQSLSVRGSVLLFLSLFSFNRFGGKWQTPSLQKYLHHYFTVAEGRFWFCPDCFSQSNSEMARAPPNLEHELI